MGFEPMIHGFADRRNWPLCHRIYGGLKIRTLICGFGDHYATINTIDLYAVSGTWTHMWLLTADFESAASANSAMTAKKKWLCLNTTTGIPKQIMFKHFLSAYLN